jgi:hypothetical protein
MVTKNGVDLICTNVNLSQIFWGLSLMDEINNPLRCFKNLCSTGEIGHKFAFLPLIADPDDSGKTGKSTYYVLYDDYSLRNVETLSIEIYTLLRAS